ncbi:MAG: type IV secretion system DNA-binding domain-containing protein [Verrucomicrobia bacterium]|nr:type IV secretion system DNA-binding domain-containing protein [Verrucomicrobiota bacterium]
MAARQLAANLILEDMSAHSFFTDAARETLVAVCQSFIKTAPGKWTLRDVLLAMQNREHLLSLLARDPQISAAAQLLLNEEQTCANILSTSATKLAPFEVIAACWHHASEKLSLDRWLHNESVILLGDNPLFHRSIVLINQTIIGCLAYLILRQQESASRRTWFFFDDVSETGRLDALPALMQRGRSNEVCVALGFRRIEEIRRLYGSPVAEELSAACSHKTALRTDDLETASWVEREFGPPLRASDLMSLPLAGPKNGFAGFHRTPRAGTYFAHKPWDWVLANLQPPKNAAPDEHLRPGSKHHLEDWTEADYQRLGFDDSPPPGLNASPK